MGRKKKSKAAPKIDYQVSIWTREENQRLYDYLLKEYNITIPVEDTKTLPKWFFFSLPEKDKVIDKQFSSLVRRAVNED